MDFSIPEFLSDEHSLGVFLLVTVLMGGSAALLAGRKLRCPILRSRFRMFIETLPKCSNSVPTRKWSLAAISPPCRTVDSIRPDL